jgi:hypothetical protein
VNINANVSRTGLNVDVGFDGIKPGVSVRAELRSSVGRYCARELAGGSAILNNVFPPKPLDDRTGDPPPSTRDHKTDMQPPRVLPSRANAQII